jgi:hypothetical protein
VSSSSSPSPSVLLAYFPERPPTPPFDSRPDFAPTSQVSGARVLAFNRYTRRDRFVLAGAMSFGIADLLQPRIFTNLFNGVNNPNSALQGWFDSITIVLSTPCEYYFLALPSYCIFLVCLWFLGANMVFLEASIPYFAIPSSRSLFYGIPY